MAFLGRDDFFKRIHDRMPNATSDEDISFLEDLTDTYNELENRGNTDAQYWKDKAEEIDKSWREKYKHRFFNGGDRSVPTGKQTDDNEEYDPSSVGIDDLFE